jgi:hypothetical protein
MVNLLIFIDESGDLGFKDKSTSYFIVAYVIVNSNDVYKIDKKIRDLHKEIHKTTKKRFDEFKYIKNHPDVKMRLIKIIPVLPIQVGGIYINKNRTQMKLTNPTLLYDYLTIYYPAYITLKYYNNIYKITIIIDRNKTNKQQKEAEDYLNKKIEELADRFRLRTTIPHIMPVYKDSKDVRCLQLADYIAGILREKYVNNRYDYYNIIRGKILSEYDLTDSIIRLGLY